MSSIYEIASIEEANREISKRIDEIRALHEEVLRIAQEFELRIHFCLDIPDGVGRGHNQDTYIAWNASSASC